MEDFHIRYEKQQEQKRKQKFVLTEERFNKIAERIAQELKEAAQNKSYAWRAYYSKQQKDWGLGR